MATYKVFFTNAGVPATGLSPTIPVLKRVDTQADVTAPTVYGIGGGWYTFEHEPAQAQVGYVDGTATLNAADRYIPIDLNVEDVYLDAPVAVIDTNVDTALTNIATIDGIVDTIAVDVAGLDGAAMRGTDNAALDSTVAKEASLAALATAAAVADVPTVAEFEARSLPSADYTVVADLPVAPDNAGIAAIQAKTDTLPILETGVVVTDAANSIISFKTDLASAEDNYCVPNFIKFTSGVCINQTRKISAYGGTSKLLLVTSGFTDIPAVGDTFKIINE